MNSNTVNLRQKLALLTEHWSPKIVAQLNDYNLKVVKVQGEFVWHDHPDTDEVFLVIAGSLDIEMRDETVTLGEGELFVVPQGVEHRPVAREECHILLIEPAGTVNTGEAKGTAAIATTEGEWI